MRATERESAENRWVEIWVDVAGYKKKSKRFYFGAVFEWKKKKILSNSKNMKIVQENFVWVCEKTTMNECCSKFFFCCFLLFSLLLFKFEPKQESRCEINKNDTRLFMCISYEKKRVKHGESMEVMNLVLSLWGSVKEEAKLLLNQG